MTRGRLLAWSGLTCCVLAGLALGHDVLRVRNAIALTLLLLVGGAIVATRAYGGWSRRAPLLVGLGLSIVIAMLAVIAKIRFQSGHHHDSVSFAMATLLVQVVLGSALALWLAAVCAGPDDVQPGEEPWWSRHVGLLAGVVAFITLLVAHAIVAPAYRLNYDEQVYLMQSRWLTAPGFGAMADDALRPFLPVGFYFVHAGKLYTHYPVGWPMLLAAARAIGVLPIVGPLFGALAVAGCAALGRRWFSGAIGASAAAMLLTQQWFLEAGAGYMTHAPTTACAVWAAYLLFRAESADGSRQLACAAGAGLLLGLAFDIRPLTGLTMGAGLALWHAMRVRSSARLLRSAAAVAVGGLAPALLLLAYNSATTGSAFALGYTKSQGSPHQMGFGVRGNHIVAKTVNFGPALASLYLLERMMGLMRDVLAPFLVVPVVALTVARGARARWSAVLPFLLLPLAHAFYFGSRDRFLIDILPFVAIGLAMLIWQTSQRPWRAALVVVVLAACNLIFASEWMTGDLKRAGAEESRITREIERLSHERRMLVLIGPKEPRLPFLLHGADSTAPVLVFNSLGAVDSTLLRRFPDREAVRVTWDSARTRASLTPLRAP